MITTQLLFTQEMDERLKQVYLHYRPGQIMALVKEWNSSHKLIRQRANQLNLPVVKGHSGLYQRWTAPEVRLLMEYEHYTGRQLSAVLKKHGFDRTKGSIDCFRRKHHHWLDRHHRDEFVIGYTTFQLEELLGIEHTTIRRWILRGWLEGKKVDGPNYRVRREHLLKFLIENPGHWKINQVDTYWFTDLLHEFMILKPKSISHAT